LIIPVIAAGEFLDGAAMVSPRRLQEAIQLLRARRIVGADFQAAEAYGHVVSALRHEGSLSGRSQNDLWIAAVSLSVGARLLTRNARHYDGISGLDVLTYG